MSKTQQDIIFFDGVCNLCSNTVQFIIKNNSHKDLRFSSLQSDFAHEKLKKHPIDLQKVDRIYFLTRGQLLSQSDAILAIFARLDGIYPYLSYLKFIPSSLRDWGYQFIAKRRYRWFGKKDTCMIPSPELKSRFLDQV